MLLTKDSLLIALNMPNLKADANWKRKESSGNIYRLTHTNVHWSNSHIAIEFNSTKNLVTRFEHYKTIYETREIGKQRVCTRTNRNIITVDVKDRWGMDGRLIYNYSIKLHGEEIARYIITAKGSVINYSDTDGNEYKEEWETPFPFLNINDLIKKIFRDDFD
jgi:hypothetical protein